MNKDNELKKDPQYQMSHLRVRIDRAIKDMRDSTEEMDQPQAKIMPVIPVTGSDDSSFKYTNNKSRTKF